MVALAGDISGNGMNQGDLAAVLANIVTMLTELKLDHDAIVTDATAIRAEVVKLVTDMGTRITEHNTLTTKLNADAGVTDTNYAAATAITAGNPAAVSSTTIAATTPSLNRS